MSDDEKKGFSGFGSLLSDVDPENILKDLPTDPVKTDSDTTDEPLEKNNKLFGPKAKWFFGFLGVIILIGILADENGSNTTYNSGSTYQPSQYQASNDIPANNTLPQQLETPQSSGSSTQAVVPAQQDLEDVAPSPQTSKASFDCSTAKSTLEILICSDDQLSSLDGQVGSVYTQVRDAAANNNELRESLLDEQRKFLKERLETCKIPYQSTLSEYESRSLIDCLKVQYNARLKTLQSYLVAIHNPQQNNEDLSPEIKNSITAGTQKFFDILNSTGLAGVKIFVNSCYDENSSEHQLIYCITFDAVASGLIPAIEQKNNYPLTPEFENSVYQARVRKRLTAAGITDPYEQANIITGIESEAGKAVQSILADAEKTGQ